MIFFQQQSQKSNSLQRLFALFLTAICVLSFAQAPSAHATEDVKAQSVTLPDDVKKHLADEDEKGDVLRIAFSDNPESKLSPLESSSRSFDLSSKSSPPVGPENYIVEKRSDDVFITYGATEESGQSVTP